MSTEKPSMYLNLSLIKKTFDRDEEILGEKYQALPGLEITISNEFIGTLYVKPNFDRVPNWVKFLSKAKVPQLDAMTTRSSSAVLLVRTSGRVFAFVFGYGRYLLNPSAMEERFGLITTLNSINRAQIRSIDRKVIDSLSRQVREFVNKDTEVRYFGIDIEQDMLSSVTGMSNIPELGTRISGRDIFSAAIKILPEQLPTFATQAFKQFNKKDYQKDFGWIDNIKEVIDPSVKSTLNDELLALLSEEVQGNRQAGKIWMAVPEIVDWVRIEGFRFSQSESAELNADLHLTDFFNSLRDPTRINMNTLKSRRAFAIDHESGATAFQWSVIRCICCELEHNNETYILSDGKWYQIESSYVETVDRYVGQIQSTKLTLPEYKHNSEEDYNKAFVTSKACPSALMDKKLINYGGGHSSIEFCDILSNKGHIIHVKKYGGSSTLSHLFAQGAVSAELFLFDTEFRKHLNQKLPSDFKLEDPSATPNSKKYEVAFAIVSRSERSLKLPFFSRVNLRNIARRLTKYDYKVSLTKIIDASK